MTTFNFTTREEYLAYRVKWKTSYIETSRLIRNLKKEIRNKQCSGQYAGNEQCDREMARVKQRKSLEELAKAKIEASEQYKARKELERRAA